MLVRQGIRQGISLARFGNRGLPGAHHILSHGSPVPAPRTAGGIVAMTRVDSGFNGALDLPDDPCGVRAGSTTNVVLPLITIAHHLLQSPTTTRSFLGCERLYLYAISRERGVYPLSVIDLFVP